MSDDNYKRLAILTEFLGRIDFALECNKKGALTTDEAMLRLARIVRDTEIQLAEVKEKLCV